MLPDLTLPGHPEVFVVGDMMALDHLPGVAEVAMQGGLHAANSISRRLRGEEVRPYRYRDLGSAATVGRFRSVVDFHGVRLGGAAAQPGRQQDLGSHQEEQSAEPAEQA